MKRVILARDLMSRPVKRLTARARVRDAGAFLLRNGISGAPVEDEHGRWMGVFTLNDLARAVATLPEAVEVERTLEAREPVPADPGSVPVADHMSAGMVTVFPDATLAEIVRSMVGSDVHRVFVVEGDTGELVGVITTLDILKWLDGIRIETGASRSEAR